MDVWQAELKEETEDFYELHNSHGGREDEYDYEESDEPPTPEGE